MENQNLLFDLLSKINLYYPIGLPHKRDDYPGYIQLTKKVEEKINILISNKPLVPWIDLVSSLSSQIKHQSVLDQSYNQFPNYLISLDLFHTTYDGIEHKKSVFLTISLLVEYYTIYFQDVFKFSKLKNGTKPSSLNFIYCKSQDSEEDNTIVDIIKESTHNRFPQYKFLPHELIMKYQIIGGIPFGEPETTSLKYPIFNFLFDNLSLNPEQVRILR